MKLPTCLAIMTALLLMHYLFILATPTVDHALVPNTSSAGFSFQLITSNEGVDNSIRHGSDGFLHLQHNHRTDQLAPSGTSTSMANATTLRPVLTHALAVRLSVNDEQHQYYLKADTSSVVTWLQCKPCDPQAQQYNAIFDPAASPTFRNVPGTSATCRSSPFHAVARGRLCNFRLNGPRGMDVEGFLAEEKFIARYEIPDFLFGCSHFTRNFESEGRYAGVANIGRGSTSLVMQIAAHGPTRFSYCLSGDSKTKNHHGFLRFGTDVPHHPRYRTTKILPVLNAHESEYYVSLVGVSLGTRRLDGIRPEMFARSKDGQGGCVIDLGTSLTMVIREAYHIIKEAMWSDLRSHGSERVKRPGFGLCVRATEAIKGRLLQPLSLHFPEEKAVLELSPKQLYLMMNDEEGQVACLAMTPGHRTVIGALQQVDTRFVYNIKDSTLSFAPESCISDTVEVA